MFTRSFLFLLGAALLIGAITLAKVSQVRAMMAQDFTPPPSAVATATAQNEIWQQTIHAVGSLNAVQGIVLTAELDGKVTEIAFESGAEVKAGDLLLRQDVSSELAQLADAEARAVLARINYERARDLRAQGANAQAELDAALATANSAEASIAAIKAVIDKKTLRAPFDGHLGIRSVNFGQFLNGGNAIVPLFSLDPIYVDFSLPQQQITTLAVGQEVKISIDAFAGKIFAGKITAINPQMDAGTRNVRAQATLTNPDGRLRPGMFAKVEVVLPQADNFVTLPATAISFNPYGDSVFVVEEDKAAKSGLVVRQRFVRVGPRRGSQVAILQGVEAGNQVVVGGLTKLSEGAAVEINNNVLPSSNPAPSPADT